MENVDDCFRKVIIPATPRQDGAGASGTASNTEGRHEPTILLDEQREWYAELHGPGPSSSAWNLLWPTTLANFVGSGANANRVPLHNGVESRQGGEHNYLGGVFVLDGNGREVWRHKETRFGDIADTDRLEEAMREALQA
ncbi:unnamed protein product [Amoebophrya sp. A25]|nr:unnamed protein product [Amoebophrya sp. A25]|eukprot:GSA25T00016267001.1